MALRFVQVETNERFGTADVDASSDQWRGCEYRPASSSKSWNSEITLELVAADIGQNQLAFE